MPNFIAKIVSTAYFGISGAVASPSGNERGGNNAQRSVGEPKKAETCNWIRETHDGSTHTKSVVDSNGEPCGMAVQARQLESQNVTWNWVQTQECKGESKLVLNAGHYPDDQSGRDALSLCGLDHGEFLSFDGLQKELARLVSTDQSCNGLQETHTKGENSVLSQKGMSELGKFCGVILDVKSAKGRVVSSSYSIAIDCVSPEHQGLNSPNNAGALSLCGLAPGKNMKESEYTAELARLASFSLNTASGEQAPRTKSVTLKTHNGDSFEFSYQAGDDGKVLQEDPSIDDRPITKEDYVKVRQYFYQPWLTDTECRTLLNEDSGLLRHLRSEDFKPDGIFDGMSDEDIQKLKESEDYWGKKAQTESQQISPEDVGLSKKLKHKEEL